MTKVTRRRLWHALGVLCLALLVLAGCSGGGSETASGERTRLTIQLITDEQAPDSLRRVVTSSAALRVEPGERLFVTRLVVSVSGADFTTITQAFDVGENEQEVIQIQLQQRIPTGPNRTVAVSLANDRGEEIFRGSTSVNLTRAVEEATVGLIRLFLPVATTPENFSSRLSNRAFRFANGAAFGMDGEVTLRFGALVNNSGRFTLTSGGLTATGTITISTSVVTSSQRQVATPGQLRQDVSSILADFSFENSSLSFPAPQTGEVVSANIQMDEFDDTLNVTTSDGNSRSDPPELALGTPPESTIDTPTENVSISPGQSVGFAGSCIDADNTTPFGVAWNFGGGAANVTVEDPGAVTFLTPGTFTVTFTCTDALGAIDATPATRTVTVEGINSAPESTIDTPTENVSISPGQSVTFSGSCIDADNTTPFGVAWNFGGGAANVTVEDPGAVTFSIPGTFAITFTCTDALGATDPTPATRTVTVENQVDMVVTVFDVITHDVLSGATVSLSEASGITDAGGLVTFTRIVVEAIRVSVTQNGYLPHVFVRVIHADTTGLNLFLYPLSQGAVDTDQDGFPDSVETNTGIFLSALNTGTAPNNADTDGDQLTDGVEILVDEVRLGD